MDDIRQCTLPVSDILVIDRAREDFGDLESLALSLKKEGIIQPLAVQETDDPAKFRLLAGGRRIRACALAKITHVPVRVYAKGLTEEQIKSIELMENVCRKDMTWQEATLLKKQIHDLQVKIHGTKISTTPGAEGWSQKDTANLLGKSVGVVSEDLKLAEAMKAFPQIAEAKTKGDAEKMLNKLKEQLVLQEIAKRVQTRSAATPLEHQKLKLIDNYMVGDTFEMMAKLPNNSIDLAEVDPIYGVELDKQKRADGDKVNMKDYKEMPADKYIPFLDSLAKELFRVLGDNSWCLVWFGPDPWFEIVYQSFVRVGFKGCRIPGIWTKTNTPGQTMQPAYRLGNGYEMFFYFYKGAPSINRQGRSNVFDFKPVSSAKKQHPTEKPIELYQEILQTFGWGGCRVLVPFLGSGNTLLAASNLQMSAFGTDLAQEYKDAYILKVNEAQPGQYKSYKTEA